MPRGKQAESTAAVNQTDTSNVDQSQVEDAEALAKQKDLEAEQASKSNAKFKLVKRFAIDGVMFDTDESLSKLTNEQLESVKKSGYVA